MFLFSCAHAPQPPKAGPPQRIISIVPSVTEALFAFGLADKVIGVSNFDRFPPEVETKQRVGGLIDPDIEKIIAMHPDLVITYGTQDGLQQHLRAVGIPTFPYVHGNVEQTLQFMLDLGKVAGAEEASQQMVQGLRKTFDDVRARAPVVAPKVLLVHSREAGTLGSFYSAGRRAFQHDLIEMAGGRNIFGDVDQETIQPTLEDVISRKPDIIVETLTPPVDPAAAAQRKKDWEKLGLAKGRIYIEGESYFLVPGPSLGLAAQRLSEIIRGK
ncbi:MAG TPA: helical backbone metal receptor [Terriglobia bacterium]